MMKLKKIKIRYNVFVFLIVLLIFISLFVPAVRAEDELLDGYYTVYEEKSDKKIFATSMVVNVGDEYLDEDNKLYEIVKVEGK